MGAGVRHGQRVAKRGGDKHAVVAVLPESDDGNFDGGAGELDVRQPLDTDRGSPAYHR
ncbi:hypothetical protein D9M72_509120 [compost metagenome]